MRDVYIILTDGVIQYITSSDTNIQIHELHTDHEMANYDAAAKELNQLRIEEVSKLPRIYGVKEE